MPVPSEGATGSVIMDLIQNTEGVKYPRFICENEDYRGLMDFQNQDYVVRRFV